MNPLDPLLPRPIQPATRELEKLVELNNELPTVRVRVVVVPAASPDDPDVVDGGSAAQHE